MIFSPIISAWIMGAVGSAHCALMCGGAASLASGGVVQIGKKPRVGPLGVSLAYNGGRIASYSVAGIGAGAVGVALDKVPVVFGAEIALRIFAGVLLCAVGLYVSGAWRKGAVLERIGLPIWKRIEPYARRLVPIRSVTSALALGALWGFMPCGLVYAGLGIAVASGSPLLGGITMLAFGLGTLPALLMMGAFGVRLGKLAHHTIVRRVAGVTILLFGIFHVVAAGAQIAAPRTQPHACCLKHARA